MLIGFDKTKLEDDVHLGRMVHFFLYDYKFERVWKQPDTDIEKLSRYRAVFSPDFSMYLEMAPVMQLYNVFRNRWCGAYWASKGLRVIPTINWGDKSTFDFCFEGVEKGSVVAVSAYMASAHGNREDQKDWFMAGYNEMLRRIQPEKVICYNTPFSEMQGDIVFVDYDKSSWRYMEEGKSVENKGFLIRKTGYIMLPKCDTMQTYQVELGGGSAYGGNWRPNPNKPQDQRYLGTPGEIKTTIMPNGDVYKTKIGEDGRASFERHYTDHNRPWFHSNPHDHVIEWVDPPGYPHQTDVINYWEEVPEFKELKGDISMNSFVPCNSTEQNRFITISDFKDCMKRHGETEFIWKANQYSITHYDGYIYISKANQRETEMKCNTADEVLEYRVGEDRLRDVIKDVEVIYRTI